MELDPTTRDALARFGSDPRKVERWLAGYSCWRTRQGYRNLLIFWARDYIAGRTAAKPPIPEHLWGKTAR
jgi:hypothetical protein